VPDPHLTKFEQLFRALFKPLSHFALKYVGDWDEAKGLVHEVFVAVWEKFESLPADTQYQSYLYTAVRNRCLNYIRDKKTHLSFENVPENQLIEVQPSLETSELEREIEMAIRSLPEKCRMVFELSRREGLKYAQIAEKMEISVKTVEAQMSKALGIMKKHLSEFLSLLFFVFWY
jgi:RNA polymerase sigma-70 factor (ECF subfamily)